MSKNESTNQDSPHHDSAQPALPSVQTSRAVLALSPSASTYLGVGRRQGKLPF